MHYVALSRLRSIPGLHILNMNEKQIGVSKKVQEEMTRLRQKTTLNSHIPVRAYTNSTKETRSSTEVHQQQDDELLRLIDKFHKSVSTSPLYICLCCDQLWYKNSVCSTAKCHEICCQKFVHLVQLNVYL